jgi:hypothetical protein
MIDDMVISLLEGCYALEYADITSHFYQLTVQTLQTPPNIIGPLKPPTGKTFRDKSGRVIRVTKKVEEPQEVECSIWVIRGFYPGTGIPYKMTVWFNSHNVYGDISGSKVVMGTYSDKNKWTHVDCYQTREYVEEVAEKTLLDESVDDEKKPKDYKKRTYKCMSPKGLSLQKKVKQIK